MPASSSFRDPGTRSARRPPGATAGFTDTTDEEDRTDLL